MGIADLIPGVSGGTIAFITGIYQRLIHSLSNLDFSFAALLLKGKFKQSYGAFNRNDLALFIPLGLGIAVSILSFSRIMNYLLLNQAAVTYAFFFGLILASAFVFLKHAGILKVEKFLFFILGLLVAYWLGGGVSVLLGNSLPVIFVSGMIAISAMLLPGISGAFLLLLLGQYQYIIEALHSHNLVVIAVFGAGALSGLLVFSKVIDYLLRNFKYLMISFLIGLMVGALRVPLRETTFSSLAIGFGLFGFVLVFGLDRFLHR